MEGCVAASEVPGISAQEASVFGGMAEDIIYTDFFAQYGGGFMDIFRDDNNPAAYLFFLARNNPQFVETRQTDYFGRIRSEGLERIPDFLVDKAAERAFYEVKPDSRSGLAAGVEKVGTLSAVYRFYGLPYVPGTVFQPRDHPIALLGSVVEASLSVRQAAPGLIVYKICMESRDPLQVEALTTLLRYTVRQVNEQKGSGSFRPVNLEPALRQGKLDDLVTPPGRR